MNNSFTFESIYSQFLTYIHSCTFADLTVNELEFELRKFLDRALAAFLFPQCSLEYKEVGDQFVFTDEKFSQREVNVILAYMQQYFLEWLLLREKNFEQQYYDADTKTHSQGNLMQQLNTAYKTALSNSIKTNYDYSRMDSIKRQSRLGAVNQ